MRHFYHLLINTAIAGITNFTVWFGITYFAYLETRSVFVTGVISGIFTITTALLSIWFGSLVDNHKKKNVMLASSAFSLVFFIMGAVVFYLSSPDSFATPSSPILWVMVLILMTGVIAGGVRNIAMPTLVTLVVPEDRRDKANGMVGTAFGVAFLVTSVISGLLIGFSGLGLLLILSITFTVLVLIDLWFIQVPESSVAHSEGHDSKKIDIKGTLRIILSIPGFLALILYTMLNNLLGGVFMALMDAYGLSLVPVQTWGLLWGLLSTGFIIGGVVISRVGLGKNPIRTFFLANTVIWLISSLFTIYPSIILLSVGIFIYIMIVPFIEASEQTIIQKVVPQQRQGRVFGFAHSVEQAASPLTAFLIGPLTQVFFIPFMTTGKGVEMIGSWFGTGPERGIALVFTLTGIIGLIITLIARRSKSTHLLSEAYLNHPGTN